MTPNSKKLMNDLLKNLIRDVTGAVDSIDALRSQADADGDESTAFVLKRVWERLNHAGDELKTAEAVVKAGGRLPSKSTRRPMDKSPLPV